MNREHDIHKSCQEALAWWTYLDRQINEGFCLSVQYSRYPNKSSVIAYAYGITDA